MQSPMQSPSPSAAAASSQPASPAAAIAAAPSPAPAAPAAPGPVRAPVPGALQQRIGNFNYLDVLAVPLEVLMVRQMAAQPRLLVNVPDYLGERVATRNGNLVAITDLRTSRSSADLVNGAAAWLLMRHTVQDQGAFSRRIAPFQGYFTAIAHTSNEYLGLAAFNRTVGEVNCRLVVDHGQYFAEVARDPRLRNMMVVAIYPLVDLRPGSFLFV